MDWVKDGIVDFVANTYSSFFSGVTAIVAEAVKSPSTFNSDIWASVTGFNNTVVLPISYTILSLFLLLELHSMMKRADAKGVDSIYWASQVLLKIIIAKILMDNMTTIIDAIFEISASLVTSGRNYFTVNDNVTIDTKTITDALDGQSIMSLLGYFVQALLIKICGMVTQQLSLLVIRLRFIEIYVFTAIAAIPFATLASKEYSTIGKNYIKRMAALALHVVLIMVVLWCYTKLVGTATFTSSGSDALSGLSSALGYTILMVIALFQTGGWSRSILSVS